MVSVIMIAMIIKSIVKGIIRPLIDLCVYFKFKMLFSQKEWLKNNTSRSFIDKTIHGFVFDSYNRRMVRAGGMIGIGANFLTPPILPHGVQGVFISSLTSVGKNSIILQQVTIGVSHFGKCVNHAPKIGDNVFIGAGAKLLGDITIGDNCRIGANAVVTKSVPSNSIVVGYNKVFTKDEPIDNRYFVKRDDGWYYYDNCVLVKEIE